MDDSRVPRLGSQYRARTSGGRLEDFDVVVLGRYGFC